MAPIPDPTPPPKPPALSREEQTRKLEEFRERNRRFPTLNRMATGVALYGIYSLVYALIYVAQTRQWIGLTGGFLLLLWSISLGAKLRETAKWAWWLTIVIAAFLALRFALGLAVQGSLAIGLIPPTERAFIDPFKIGVYLVGLGLASNILYFGLAKATRDLLFARADVTVL